MSGITTRRFRITGMHCRGCESIVEESIEKIRGVSDVKADFTKSLVVISFDERVTDLEEIGCACSSRGYQFFPAKVEVKSPMSKIILSGCALAGLFFLIVIARKLGHGIVLPEIGPGAGAGMVFLTGLLTGIHCIGMCGSFILGYTSRDASANHPLYRSHFLYGAGKIISYSLFGALFGLAGSFLQITPLISGISLAIAGLFLLLYGLNIMEIFPKSLTIRIKLPGIFNRFASRNHSLARSPFWIGLFSGFILGCGPLQAMYVMAAGHGDIWRGALMLGLFGLGTLPALFGFGMVSRLFTKTMSRRFIQASGIILIILGSIMLYRGVLRSWPSADTSSVPVKSCCQPVPSNHE